MRLIETPAVVAPEPDMNVTDLLEYRLRESPDAPLFSKPDGQGGWIDVTAKQFHAEVVALAKGLVASGLEVGDHIAFIGETRYEWTLVDFAIWYAGAIMVPIYETSSASQITWIINDSDAMGLITHTEAHEQRANEIIGDLPKVKLRIALHDGAIERLMAEGASVPDEEIERRRNVAVESDMATLIYTSGSTGRPKGCVLTHGNFVELSRNVKDPLKAVIYVGASTLLFVTLAHVFARFISVLALYGGVKVGHQPDTTKLVESLGTFRPTFLLAVPRVFEKVFNSAEQKAEAGGKGNIFRRAARVGIAYSRALDAGKVPFFLNLQFKLFDKLVFSKLRATLGGRVKHAVSGSAPLGPSLAHFYRALGVTIMEGYGLTETTAPISVNLPHLSKIGTVGPPLPGVGVKLGEDNEILTKGVNLFKEYWKNPEATAESFDGEWFKTGDLGDIDEDGYITVTGRTKEIIVTSGGKNVSPVVLEDPIRANTLVNQVVVVGDQRPFISALVTLDAEMLKIWLQNQGENPDMTIDEATRNPKVLAEIQRAVDRANSKVSRAESIRKFVVLDTTFTEENNMLTPKMSIKRHVILEKFANVIDNIYDAPPPTQGMTLK